MPNKMRFGRLLLAQTLILGSAFGQTRHYWPVSIENMPHNFHTHVQVTGKVLLVKNEADGDTHIKLGSAHAFIVAECIPQLPCKSPKLGSIITVFGISRFDGEHKWLEVHPVERMVDAFALPYNETAKHFPITNRALFHGAPF